MEGFQDTGDRVVLLKIQNSNKPDQMIELVMDRSNSHFVTEGLKKLFGIKEIWIESEDLLQKLPDYAEVLSFLLSAMSAAEDFRLPFAYQNEFEFHGARYTLYEKGDYRVLRKIEPGGSLGL